METAGGEVGDDLDLKFSRGEIVLLTRYCVAKVAEEQLRLWFLLKWLVLIPALALLVAFDDMVIRVVAVVLLALFVVLMLGQSLVRRALARVGAYRKLQPLDEVVDHLQGGFRDEVERVTGAFTPRKLAFTAIRLTRGRAAANEYVEQLYDLDWTRIMPPMDKFVAARQALAVASGKPR